MVAEMREDLVETCTKMCTNKTLNIGDMLNWVHRLGINIDLK